MASGERVEAGARSRGLSYQELLDTDSKPVPEVLRWESPLVAGPVQVPRERYVSREFHDLEVEKVWKKAWQMACREEELTEVGDHVVYDIADASILIVRSAEDRIQAFHNACLHRGRQLRDGGGRFSEIRCAFHGWAWKLDGELAEIPCRWDFPHVDREAHRLPEVKVGTWGGFVFVNMDPDAEPLEAFLGDLPRHFERWPLEKRYKGVHVAKPLQCNWKVAQEAFMEAYHVVATHPQLLAGIGDANSQYDAHQNFSRAITPNATPSPHLDGEPSLQDQLDVVLNRSLDAPPMIELPEGMHPRALLGQMMRMQMQQVVGGVHELTDSELGDSLYYTLFPNFHPWAAYNRIVYRFRPWGDVPHACLMEVMYLHPFRGRRPPPCDVHWLAPDEDWTRAPELGFLARVFNQDTFNLPRVQRGLRASVQGHVNFGAYQETKIRHFHMLLEKFISR
jgi:nitrite reductase/ring-hydroxylating ferredoxin subunit